MSRLADIFGFDAKRTWWYRDLALGTVAAIATLWSIVLFIGNSGGFDFKIAAVCALVAVGACAISPNRLVHGGRRGRYSGLVRCGLLS